MCYPMEGRTSRGRERGWEREGLQRILGNGCGPCGTPRLAFSLLHEYLLLSSRCVWCFHTFGTRQGFCDVLRLDVVYDLSLLRLRGQHHG